MAVATTVFTFKPTITPGRDARGPPLEYVSQDTYAVTTSLALKTGQLTIHDISCACDWWMLIKLNVHTNRSFPHAIGDVRLSGPHRHHFLFVHGENALTAS